MTSPSSFVGQRRPATEPSDRGSEPIQLRQLAYFYEPFWRSGAANCIKTLLLFFDGIALTVPDHVRGAPFAPDRTFAEQLDDLGLLSRLSPETLIDADAAETLGHLLGELSAAHAFDALDHTMRYRALSRPRCGTSTDPVLTDAVLDALVEWGLARPSCDGSAVSLHPIVRECVLVALPHIVRESAEHAGNALQPMTTHPLDIHALLDFLSLEPLPTAGHLAAMHTQQVTCDLASIPLDDVLAFRSECGSAHRAYARELREFVRAAAVLPTEDSAALQIRREELGDAAETLRRTARTTWRLPLTTCALGIAGSAAVSPYENLSSAMQYAAATFLGACRRSDPGSAYCYLFEVRDQLSRTSSLA